MIRYHVSYDNPLSHFVQITITIPDNQQQELHLQLPAWRPGRYELQHFAQKLRKVSASASGQNLEISKITKDQWVVQTKGADTVEITYSFYAYQMDAGGSWLDETQLYLNGINCFMAVEAREMESCELHLDIPEDWTIACGLPQPEKATLVARNFDELVDSPLIASRSLQHASFEAGGVLFHIWLQGNCKPDMEKIKKDFKAYTLEQLKVFGDFPVSEYHYLNQILPYRFFHGVEHSNSTVITVGPAEQLMLPSLYKEFVGVSSHELFHTWNIKKIRPAEMMPYNFTQENYFKTGYVAEGVTTYYGDYMLARSGVFTADQYFDELNTTLQRYFADYSRNNLSVADSSFDLWLDGYKPGVPDRKVSIYVKGALTAMLLDLKLRQATSNSANLDTIMQRLWLDFGKRNIGYTEHDYVRLVECVAGTSFQDYFDDFINGTAPIESALNDALQFVGCTLMRNESALLHESRFGFKVADNQTVKITAIAPGSPAYHSLSVDDELVALNGRKLEQNLQQLLSETDLTTSVTLTLFRNKQLKEVSLATDSNSYYSRYTISKRDDATDEQKNNFKLWLKQEFHS